VYPGGGWDHRSYFLKTYTVMIRKNIKKDHDSKRYPKKSDLKSPPPNKIKPGYAPGT